MKDFNIRFEGKWFFDYTYSANSKEEALKMHFKMYAMRLIHLTL